jgi:hypothetical protein
LVSARQNGAANSVKYSGIGGTINIRKIIMQRDIFTDPAALAAWGEEMAEKSRQKNGSAAPPATDESLPANVVRLPVWPDSTRGVPNGVLRSALFGAIRKGKRPYLTREPLAAQDGITILYTGPRLNQNHLDVWEQCLHLARTQGLGCQIRFSAYGFLKAIGRSTGKAQHEWLKNMLAELASAVPELKDGRRAYSGPLLHNLARDDKTGQHVIELNPETVRLYGSGGWSQIEWDERQALKGQPLAQWLHGFYSTHASAFPMKVETLHRLCGSETREMKHFRAELRQALDHITRTAGWVWMIDENDLVHVERQPSASQQKHLVRKTARPRRKEK